MGRPYKSELCAMSETYQFAKEFDISKIVKFFSDNIEVPLLVIGSGGSFAVAKMFALCYQTMGGFSKAVTPFEVRNETKLLHRTKVLIVSAGGNNPDTVGIYEYVKLYETYRTFVICMAEKSKIISAAQNNSDTGFFQTKIPFGKDGFLAVNSSVAMFTIACRLVNIITFGKDTIKETNFDISDVISNASIDWKKVQTIVVLYGGWTMPAAFDFESKCSEAGLKNVQLADFRNFAHGRHHWLAKKSKDTILIAFDTALEKKICERTIELLPNEIPILRLHSDNKSIEGGLDALIQMFYIVDKIGEACGIDPGRPQVPEFGCKLYNVRYSLKNQDEYIKKLKKEKDLLAISRKVPYDCVSNEVKEYYEEHLKKFKHKIEEQIFCSLVLDFDGTVYDKNIKQFSEIGKKMINDLLTNRIAVGFATGRGDSIIPILRKNIETKYWENVIIGFYNGAIIKKLNEVDELVIEQDEVIQKFYEKCEAIKILSGKCRNKNIQLVFLDDNNENLYLYEQLIKEIKQNEKEERIKIVRTQHSIDVIRDSSSKQNLVETLKLQYGNEVLCIGDEGRLGENDYEMLSEHCSLSSDKQNMLGISGWNLAPMGIRGCRATEYYMNLLHIEKGFFKIIGL